MAHTMTSTSCFGDATLPSSHSQRAATIPLAVPGSSRSRPRTTVTSIGNEENDIVYALSEAKGISPTVGLAFVNISTSEAVLCQFSDTQTFARTCHKLKVFDPSEILFSRTATDSKLISIIRENIDVVRDHVKMIPLDRGVWSELAGHEFIQQLSFPSDLEPLRLAAMSNYFAICSFAAVMKYLETTMDTTFVPHALRIRSEPSEGAMLIDVSTISSLELVQNSLDPRSKHCLFGLLNQTRTKMGNRLLRSNVLQPSTDEDKIRKRYATVSELSRNTDMLAQVRSALTNFVDVDRVLAALVIIACKADFAYMEQSINIVILLKTFIDMILPVWQALESAVTDQLICNQEMYIQTKVLLDFALNTNVRYSAKPAELRNQRVWALNAGVNGFLDVARQTYKEVNQDIEQLVERLCEQHNLNLELKFDPARQFFVKIKLIELDEQQIPEVFINLHQNRRFLECQTMDLIKLNQRLKDAHNEVVMMSNKSIQELIGRIRTGIQPLFQISEAIALLDMLAAFAYLAIEQSYVEPEITSALAIKSCRHPLRENMQSGTFVPNDVYATEQSRFQIITGCNMSGKSTYIRSIALTTIMAQTGCFVPADYASFPISHQLFARVSTDDSIEASMSSFSAEMRETAFILHNIEPRSLVIIDELGRGTSTRDGLAIAIAIAEAMIESRALVWFVTHFRDLPKILAERAGVVNLHLMADISSNLSTMKMRYKISDGIEKQKFYGLALARVAKLPREVIDDAARIAIQLNQRKESSTNNQKSVTLARKRKLVLKLKEQLLQARESVVDREALRMWLHKLQEEFTIRMNSIDSEIDADTNMSRPVDSQNHDEIDDDGSGFQSQVDEASDRTAGPITPSPSKVARSIMLLSEDVKQTDDTMAGTDTMAGAAVYGNEKGDASDLIELI